MIRIEGLSRSFAGVPVLRDIDLEVTAGEVLVLVGPSGTGKSVLLKHMIGLLEPDAGEVWINGRALARASYRELASIRRSMGYVFQDAALLDSLTVHQNLRLALDDAQCRRVPGYAGTRIAATLAAVNLDPQVLHRLPGQLSGGMRKRAGVARAIINEPGIILYDEPTTGLDPRNVAAINELVLSNRQRFGATSVVVTHDMPSLRGLADRVGLLDDGALRFLGTPDEFFAATDPVVRAFTAPTTGTQPAQEEAWQVTHADMTR